MINYLNIMIIEKIIKIGVNKYENVRRCLYYLYFLCIFNVCSDDSI